MKVSELKRMLVPGTKLRLVYSLMGPCDKLRVVAKTNTVDVMFTGDGIKEGQVSHLAWPKAANLRETPNGFEITEDNGEVSARYVWGEASVPVSKEYDILTKRALVDVLADPRAVANDTERYLSMLRTSVKCVAGQWSLKVVVLNRTYRLVGDAVVVSDS